ncbi:MAG: DNA-directed RNA polymerase subunit alpha [Actinobacteria bacterium]|nr:DNA-directed RNA polymerase subunit alpha [Actinomycetota bacterium]
MLKMHKPNVSKEQKDEFESIFTIEPLERGFGHTLGNSIRRVLLSSIEGAGITKLKVENVSHEFSVIDGLKEDILELIANLKTIVFKMEGDEPVKIRLKKSSAGEIKASDIKLPAGVEIINPDAFVGNLADDAKIDIELTLEKNKGYSTAEENTTENMPIGEIPLDTIFSPIKRVSFKIENTRVGQMTNFDKLVLDVKTNGSMKPEDALSQASKIINDYMALLIDLSDNSSRDPIFDEAPAKEEPAKDMTIDDMELSVRATNCLKREHIETLEQLLNYREDELLQIRNFGQKSIQEVKDKVKALNRSFRK